MSQAVFERIAIIGIGLIGSSIARAAVQKGAAGAVSIFDADAGDSQVLGQNIEGGETPKKPDSGECNRSD